MISPNLYNFVLLLILLIVPLCFFIGLILQIKELTKESPIDYNIMQASGDFKMTSIWLFFIGLAIYNSN